MALVGCGNRERAVFATKGVAAVHAYWSQLADGRRMPLKCDFDPLDIARFLPGILLIEIEGVRPDGTGLYRYKVVGEWEVAARGHNPTGKLVDDGYHAASREAAIADYDQVRDAREPHHGQVEFVNEHGIPILEDSIILPFSEDGETVSHFLVYSEQINGDDALA